jgi:hypothetical protein
LKVPGPQGNEPNYISSNNCYTTVLSCISISLNSKHSRNQRSRKNIALWVWFWSKQICPYSIFSPIFLAYNYFFNVWCRSRSSNPYPSSPKFSSFIFYLNLRILISSRPTYWPASWVTRRISWMILKQVWDKRRLLIFLWNV